MPNPLTGFGYRAVPGCTHFVPIADDHEDGRGQSPETTRDFGRPDEIGPENTPVNTGVFERPTRFAAI